MDRLWTVEEVAEYLQLSKRTVQRLTRFQRIPYMRLPVGRSIRYEPDAIKKWVKCNTIIEKLR